MPAVQPESGHRTVQPVGTDYLVHAGIGGGELLVLALSLIHLSLIKIRNEEYSQKAICGLDADATVVHQYLGICPVA